MKQKVFTFPLSFAQERLWILNQINSGSPSYNVPVAFELVGRLDKDLLSKSLQGLIERHEILRTSVNLIEKTPKQFIVTDHKFLLQEVNVGQDQKNNRWIQQQLAKLSCQQIDLSHVPLFNCKLLTLPNNRNIFLINFHHIIMDEWSIGVFFRELKDLYEAYLTGREPALSELPIQYGDYAVWQREWLCGEALDRLVGYWKQKLEGLQGLELPTDHPRPAEQTFKGLTYRTRLGKELSGKVKEFARIEGVTLNMLMLAVFKALLYRYTQQEDIVVGMPMANRNRVELEDLIGFFVNTLVVRTDLSGEPTFRELVQRVKETLLEAYDHQDLPFEKLVEVLNPERDLSRTPLFQVMFVMENTSLGVEKIGDMTISPLRVDTGTSKFDLTLFVEEERDNLSVSIEYSTDLFNADRIERMAGHYQCLLEDIVEHPEKKIWELELLTEAEKHQILVEWNDTDVDYPKDKCLHQLFEEQVERTPEAVAVVFGEQQLTYRELNERANQLGHYLQKLGVGPEVLVGICVERSLEMIVGLLGILKAGGAYVPLDPNYPKERLAYMLADAQAPLLLTQTALETELETENTRVVYLDRDWEKIAQESVATVESGVQPDNLIYVIYTSGSTGKPKGAGVYHTGFVNLVDWFAKAHQMSWRDRTLVISSLSFDLTQKNYFTPLLIGGQLHLTTSNQYDPHLIIEQIAEEKITWINCAPSAFYPLVEMGLSTINNTLRFVFLGGEPILFSRLYEWFISSKTTKLVNTYGPTECTDVSTSYIVQSLGEFLNRPIPIGRPIHNVTHFILDKNMMLVPVGIEGQLYIGGGGIGKGYIGKPDLTAEKFLPNSFDLVSKTLMYRTGDLTRYLPDGDIEFLGRVDHQVKIRGYRIELGEIEAILIQHPRLQDAAVIVREDNPGDKYLAAYVVQRSAQSCEAGELRAYLKESLPDYMVPTAYVYLNALPLTPSGKINRRALPAPERTSELATEIYIPPRTDKEKVLESIWCELFGINQIGVNDNFFELGGHSLLAVQFLSQATKAGISIALKDLLAHPTIAGLAELGVDTKTTIEADQSLISGTVPLLPQQIDILGLLPPSDRNKFVIPILRECPHLINAVLLKKVIQHLMRHHDALRSRFNYSEGEWQQWIVDQESNEIVSEMDLSTLPSSQQTSEIKAIARRLTNKIDLSTGPLLQIALVNLGFQQPQKLIVLINHFVADGVSSEIFISDLEAAYLQLVMGEEIKLSPKTTSIKYFSERVLQYAKTVNMRQAAEYWLKIDLNKVHRLPVDFPKGDGEKGIDTYSFLMTQQDTKRLFRGIPESGIGIKEIMLTALTLSFKKWTGSSGLLFMMNHHGRNTFFDDIDLSRTMGYITSGIILFLDLEHAATVSDALMTIKNKIHQAPETGLNLRMAAFLNANREMASNLKQCFNKTELAVNLTFFQRHVSFSDKFFLAAEESLESDLIFPNPHKLTISGEISRYGSLKLNWHFDTRFYILKTIQNMSDDYTKILLSMIPD